MRASAVALATPLAPGISAAWKARVFQLSTPGAEQHARILELGALRRVLPQDGLLGVGDEQERGDVALTRLGQTDPEVEPERAGDLLLDERARRTCR